MSTLLAARTALTQSILSARFIDPSHLVMSMKAIQRSEPISPPYMQSTSYAVYYPCNYVYESQYTTNEKRCDNSSLCEPSV